MYFPVEMVLMVKALVTFEGVGQILKPGLDVAAVSQAHANRIFLDQFSPMHLARQGARPGPPPPTPPPSPRPGGGGAGRRSWGGRSRGRRRSPRGGCPCSSRPAGR